MRGRALFLVLVLLLAGCTVKQPAEPAPAAPPEEPPAAPPAQPVSRVVNFTWDLPNPEPGQVVGFTAHAPGAIRHVWHFGDGTKDEGPSVIHVFKDKGAFTVRLTASYEAGPDASASRIVRVGVVQGVAYAAPDITWTQTDLAIRFGFTFDATPDAIGWDFGDGRTSNAPTPLHAYERPGTYTVGLTLLVGSDFYSAEAEVDASTDLPFFRLSNVGRPGAEPSIGVTSDHCIFFMAGANVMRSCDHGASWKDTGDLLSDPAGLTFDPWMWVDPVVDRVWAVNMLGLECSWIAWSDDSGASWLANPWDCGPVPGNDHIKLASGPWPAGSALGSAATYDRAVYYCVNKVPPGATATAVAAGLALNTGVNCSISLDGGVTFPITRQATVLGTGLHGAIEVAPDGTVYVPPRYAQPTVLVSKDAGLTWIQRSMGSDVGTPDPRKNSEVSTDSASNAYHVWISQDFGVYLSRSIDGGSTWDSRSTRVSPDHIASATFPHIDAGDPGRIAVAYLGSEDHQGNPHKAPADATYYLYVTFSLNALDAEPQFTTIRVTDDPVQAGSICISSGDCMGGNRNLLDFNDLHIGPDGRVYVAFADGCTGGCINNPTASASRNAAGTVAILESGPSLYDVPALSWFA